MHKDAGLCYHSVWKAFSKWASNNEKDERELHYRLSDDEFVICNDELGANNEAILAAKNWDRKFIFWPRIPVYWILCWFRRCAGI